MLMADVGYLLLWAAGGLALVFIGAAFLVGMVGALRIQWRVLRGSGPLGKQEAHQAYGTSLLMWRSSLVVAIAALVAWQWQEWLTDRWTAAVVLVTLGLGWYARDLGARRMHSSLQGGGCGPNHLRM